MGEKQKTFKQTSLNAFLGNNAAATTSQASGISAGTTEISGKNKIPNDLGTNAPAQQTIPFPFTDFDGQKRSFQAEWFRMFPWLEYSKEADRAYCYPCRKFPVQGSDDAFTTLGYNNWKRALETDRGLKKHQSCTSHINSNKLWNERIQRDSNESTIANQLVSQQLERNRYYIKSIVEVMQFLIVNELSIRGHYDATKSSESGLFLKLFDYTLKRDQKLATIASTIPANAKYTSPDIQNEIIDLMHDMVIQQLTREIQSAVGFSLMADSTRDKQNIEDLAVATRYMNQDGAIEERCISIIQLESANAIAMSEKIINALNEHQIDTRKLLCQTYDGAAVMAGVHGGVQRLISDAVGREVPFIHCFNHQLHLAVLDTVSANELGRKYYDIVEQLYKLFRRLAVKNVYEGETLKRVLPQRWTGHLAAVEVFDKNFTEICTALFELATKTLNESAEAEGYLNRVCSINFVFCTKLFTRLLSTLAPLNNHFQSIDANIFKSEEVFRSCIATLSGFRTDEFFNQIFQIAQEQLSTAFPFSEKSDENSLPTASAKRTRSIPARFRNGFEFLFDEGTASISHENTQMPTQLKRFTFEAIDICTHSIHNRFSERNTKVVVASLSLLKRSTRTAANCKILLRLLANNIFFNIDSELQVLHNGILENYSSISQLWDAFLPHRHSFPCFSAAVTIALTLPISTAHVEACFSSLTQILRPQRISMAHDRKAKLLLLAYNKDITERLDVDEFISRFAVSSRRLTLK